MSPKIFILLATYNRAHLISKTLDSIQNQTYRNWECIIVDDYSQDQTQQVIQSYINRDSRFFYHHKKPEYSRGLSGTRNHGLDIAMQKGAAFIQFFDDDDIMHPRKLELQVKPFLKNPDLDLTICCYRKFIKEETIEFNLQRAQDGSCKIKTDNLLKSFFVHQINLNSPGPLWRAQVLRDFRFNEKLKYAEEREFYLRIFLNEKLKFEPVQEILFWYRKHDKAITKNLYNDREQNMHSYQLFYEVFLEEVLKQIKAPAFILKFYAVTAVKDKNRKNIKKIVKYITGKSRWQNFGYIKIFLYLKLKSKLNNY